MANVKLGLKTFSYAVEKIPDSVWHKIPGFKPPSEDGDNQDDQQPVARKQSKSSSKERSPSKSSSKDRSGRKSSPEKRTSRSPPQTQPRVINQDEYIDPFDVPPNIPQSRAIPLSGSPTQINSVPNSAPQHIPQYDLPPQNFPQYIPPDPHYNPPAAYYQEPLPRPRQYSDAAMASDPYYPAAPAQGYRPYEQSNSPRKSYNPQDYAPIQGYQGTSVDPYSAPNGYAPRASSTGPHDRHRSHRHSQYDTGDSEDYYGTQYDRYDDDRRGSQRTSHRKKSTSSRNGSQDRGFKAKLQRTFEPSEKGLTDSAIGAVAGGLIGHEIGHGPLATVAGIVLGGLGGNAWAARENRHRDGGRGGDRDSGGSKRRTRSEGRRSSRYDDYDRRRDYESDEDEGYGGSGSAYDPPRGYEGRRRSKDY